MLLQIVSIKNTILVIGSQWVNRHSQDFAYHSERLFQPEFLKSINMVKVLSLCFEQCFGPFNFLLVKRSSEKGLSDIYLTTCFRVCKFKNTSAMSVILLLKMFKIGSKYKKGKKNSENVFRFWDNCIWKCCYKLSLLRTEYLLSTVSRLTKVLQIFQSLREKFPTQAPFTRINKCGKGAVVQLWTVFRAVSHGTCRRVLWNRTFQTFL